MKAQKTLLHAAAVLTAVVLTAGVPVCMQQGKPQTAFAAEENFDYTYEDNGTYTYHKYADHIAITGMKSDPTDLVIPESIDGMPVTSVGIYAFQYSNLKSITFPETITEIGPYAFTNCPNLTSVTFPESLEHLKWQCFTDCEALTEVNFPSKGLQAGDFDFDNTPWLTAQRAKDPLVIVNNSVIDGRTCSGAVTIPKGVKYVASGAFSRNDKITSLTVPSSVSVIADCTCFQCDNLTSVELNGCTSIGRQAFQECNKLTEMKISGKLTKFMEYCFADNTASATITFYGSESTWNQVQKPENDQFLQRARMIFDESHQDDDDDEVIGDINKDGACNAADAELLQKWLLAVPGTELPDWKAGDLNADDKLTATDLTLLKQVILSK